MANLSESAFVEWSANQAREYTNTAQRFAAMQQSVEQADRYVGSMFWREIEGRRYLVRSRRDKVTGRVVQRSLGPDSEKNRALKDQFDRDQERARANERADVNNMKEQAAINRAVRLGRMPDLSARLADHLLSPLQPWKGLRIVGTNALYVYEALAGVALAPEVMQTDDLDILYDSRRTLKLTVGNEKPATLLAELQKVDRSFRRTRRTYCAVNRDGFMVDIIKPLAKPPWADTDEFEDGDVVPAAIEGLGWLQNAEAVSAMVIAQNGWPVEVTVPTPDIFAIYKIWLSARENREPAKRRRDRLQAQAVHHLIKDYLPQYRLGADRLRVLPKGIVDDAINSLEHPS